jgi:hypothetical protein
MLKPPCAIPNRRRHPAVPSLRDASTAGDARASAARVLPQQARRHRDRRRSRDRHRTPAAGSSVMPRPEIQAKARDTILRRGDAPRRATARRHAAHSPARGRARRDHGRGRAVVAGCAPVRGAHPLRACAQLAFQAAGKGAPVVLPPLAHPPPPRASSSQPWRAAISGATER